VYHVSVASSWGWDIAPRLAAITIKDVRIKIEKDSVIYARCSLALQHMHLVEQSRSQQAGRANIEPRIPGTSPTSADPMNH
jgi:hypothetical protein